MAPKAAPPQHSEQGEGTPLLDCLGKRGKMPYYPPGTPYNLPGSAD